MHAHWMYENYLPLTHALYLHQGGRSGWMEVTKRNGPRGCGA